VQTSVNLSRSLNRPPLVFSSPDFLDPHTLSYRHFTFPPIVDPPQPPLLFLGFGGLLRGQSFFCRAKVRPPTFRLLCAPSPFFAVFFDPVDFEVEAACFQQLSAPLEGLYHSFLCLASNFRLAVSFFFPFCFTLSTPRLFARSQGKTPGQPDFLVYVPWPPDPSLYPKFRRLFNPYFAPSFSSSLEPRRAHSRVGFFGATTQFALPRLPFFRR